MAAAPYWGELPGPKKATAQTASSKPRRFSGDPHSLDPPAAQPQPKANRVSIQTTNTEAPTESTLSPFASPTAPSFQDHGLAPRPPSFPYGGPQYPQDPAAERSRRRRSREPDLDLDLDDADADADADGPPPPAAPDVPRAPPVSYRHPYGNGGLPYSHAAPPALPRYPKQQYALPPGPPGPPAAAMDAGEYYDEQQPVLDRSRRTFDPASSSRRRSSGAVDPIPQGRSSGPRMMEPPANGGHPRDLRSSTDPTAQHRRTSLGGQSERRRHISKEEKRARMEAAEKLIRDKEMREHDKPPAQQVRFQEEAAHEASSPAEPPRAHPELAVHKGPLTQNPPEEGKRYGSAGRSSSRGDEPESRIPVRTGSQGSGIPQRNLSFRERAARNDLKLPGAGGGDSGPSSPTSPSDGAAAAAAAVAAAAPAVARSGSNKLRKEPPGDPWYGRRVEAERRYPTIDTRNGPGLETAESEPVTVRRAAPGSVRIIRPPGTDGSRAAPEEAMIGRSESVKQAPAKLSKSPSQRRAGAGPDLARSAGTSADSRESLGDHIRGPAMAGAAGAAGAAVMAGAIPTRRAARAHDDDSDDDGFAQHHHRVSNMVYHARDRLKPGQGMFKAPQYLDEWRKGTVGTLSGALLDLNDDGAPADRDKAWWETPSKRRGSLPSRPLKAEAFDGEYDETNAPTRFKPPLHLKCGPLLRFCGTRTERAPTRSHRNGTVAEREIWRGSVLIVTQDRESSYEIAPTLRMFLQPIELLPPPPAEVQGALPPEYVDPIAGHPKLGRKGETLYVRPVDLLDEAIDLSRDETDEGLFEKTRTPLDEGRDARDAPGSFAARRKRIQVDGEKLDKHKDVRGFRLHAERGLTFWRFNIEVELRERQQRIAYRINRGPSTGFWVPAKGQSMNIMFYSCNGFSMSVNPDEFSGPDPLWRDVLNTHQTQPFHVMVGGGDQIYNDAVIGHTKLFQEWLMIKNPLHKHNAPFTAELQDELETFYLERYCMWFSQGLFGLANSQIPMVNMYDDHDIIDGFGSYPHHFMNSPVFSGLGNVAFKYYMLFQHQSVTDETEKTEPSWILGSKPGPYINELGRSLFISLGVRVALLAVDCRTERTRDEVLREETWKKIMDRCYAEIVKGKTEHLLVLLGVPIAYPRLVWLENILTSRLMDPIKALGKVGMFGGLFNKFDGGVEVLDDLDDHWTAKDHKDERRVVIEDLQDLAADKSVRVTILSGDVHLAAVGQFYSHPKLGLAKHKDFRYMPNVISSAIVNTPPPDIMADILNKRNKVHHFDPETEEDMIPMFNHGVEGQPRNNKRLLPHRNWCSIREYVPGNTPPHTPDQSAHDLTPVGSPPGGKGLLRRLSKTRRGPSMRPDASRPPLSGSAGFLRTFSRGRESTDNVRQDRPAGTASRTMSLTRGDFKPGNLFRRLSGRRKEEPADDGGINGQWGADSEAEDLPPAAARRLGIGKGSKKGRAPDPYDVDAAMSSGELPPPSSSHSRHMGLRGGGGSYDEFENGDESYFSARPSQRTQAPPAPPPGDGASTPGGSAPEPRPFHRTPTGLTARQMKRAAQYEVNLEGGLEVCLNVEVSQKDPSGITVPYRLVVPRLWYTYEGEEPAVEKPLTGIKRWLSLSRGKSISGRKGEEAGGPEEDEGEDDEEDEEALEGQHVRG